MQPGRTGRLNYPQKEKAVKADIRPEVRFADSVSRPCPCATLYKCAPMPCRAGHAALMRAPPCVLDSPPAATRMHAGAAGTAIRDRAL